MLKRLHPRGLDAGASEAVSSASVCEFTSFFSHELERRSTPTDEKRAPPAHFRQEFGYRAGGNADLQVDHAIKFRAGHLSKAKLSLGS